MSLLSVVQFIDNNKVRAFSSNMPTFDQSIDPFYTEEPMMLISAAFAVIMTVLKLNVKLRY